MTPRICSAEFSSKYGGTVTLTSKRGSPESKVHKVQMLQSAWKMTYKHFLAGILNSMLQLQTYLPVRI